MGIWITEWRLHPWIATTQVCISSNQLGVEHGWRKDVGMGIRSITAWCFGTWLDDDFHNIKKGCHPNPIDELHHFSGWGPEASTDDSAVARSTVNGAWRRLRSSWLHACRARKVARRLAATCGRWENDGKAGGPRSEMFVAVPSDNVRACYGTWPIYNLIYLAINS